MWPGFDFALGVTCGLRLLVLYSAMRGFSPGTHYYFYFQSLYNNDLFEEKGVLFNAVPNSVVLPQDFAHETVNFNLSFVVAIYCLCCSIMKSCTYWNSDTLATIEDKSKECVRIYV